MSTIIKYWRETSRGRTLSWHEEPQVRKRTVCAELSDWLWNAAEMYAALAHRCPLRTRVAVDAEVFPGRRQSAFAMDWSLDLNTRNSERTSRTERDDQIIHIITVLKFESPLSMPSRITFLSQRLRSIMDPNALVASPHRRYYIDGLITFFIIYLYACFSLTVKW